MPTSPLTLDQHQVRTVRLASQGFGSAATMPATRLVAHYGYVRTLGGCDAYLALRARHRTMHRAELDHAIERSDLQIVPAARGCIYLVPRSDVALCLRFADRMSAQRVAREHCKAGIDAGELETVAELAGAALKQHGPLTTDALRKAMPADSVRSLGERGKKVGISSPLPGALRRLEFDGRIERTPERGRADTERYLWRIAAKSPFAGTDLPEQPVELHALLLERFVAHAGVATLGAFAAWSGLSRRDAKAAVPHTDLVAVRIADHDEDAWTTTAIDRLLTMRDAVEQATAFLPFEDNLVHLHGGPGHLVDDEFLGLRLPKWNAAEQTTRLGDARFLSLRALIADGRLSGFWEYDPDNCLAVPHCFRRPSKAARQQIEELSASTSAFLRDEVGHGHSFALDADAELRTRLAQMRALDGDKVVIAARARADAEGPPKPTALGRATKRKPPSKTATPAAKAKGKGAATKSARPTSRLTGRTTVNPTKTVKVPRPSSRPTPPRRRGSK